MQLSDAEYLQVSREWLLSGQSTVQMDLGTITTASSALRVLPRREAALDAEEMERAMDAIAQQPDERATIVASLRARIESGTYQVTGEQIAEMMVRRFVGDNLR